MKATKFEDLEVWKRAHQLVLNIYKITRDFPPEEKFGLVSQMRRSAVSVPANVAEGFKKRTLKDKSISTISLKDLLKNCIITSFLQKI